MIEEILNKIGDNPIEEPKIYEWVKNGEMGKIAIEAFKRIDKTKEDIAAMNSEEVAEIVNKVAMHVSSYREIEDIKEIFNNKREDIEDLIETIVETAWIPNKADIKAVVKQSLESVVSRLQNGHFKSTPNTENRKLPNFLEAEELMDLATKREEAFLDKRYEEAEKFDKKFQDKVFKISGLDVKKLTEWEKGLVLAEAQASLVNTYKTARGKH